MNLSIEQIKALKERMAAAKTAEEIAEIRKELGSDDFAELLEKMSDIEELGDDMLENVTGGDSFSPDDLIACLKKDGYLPAVELCQFYLPTALCHVIVKELEDNLKNEAK